MRRRYSRLRTVASFLPVSVLRWLIPRWKLAEDPADGWTFWLDAAYAQYARRDERRSK